MQFLSICFMTHHFQEEVHVRPLVHEEPDWVSVDGHLEDEVRRRPRLDRLSEDAIVEGVDQGLVKVQDQDLALNQA